MTRLITIIISIVFTLISCSKDDHNPSTYTDTPVLPGMPQVNSDTTIAPRSFLALGDSYTIGQSVSALDRFPVQTVRDLNVRGIKFEAPEIIAQTGWTTGNLLNALAFSPPGKPKYDIVTLLIGVNNQYQHRTQQEYAEQFLTLLNLAMTYAGNDRKRVIVLSIPDYSVTPFASGSDKELIAKEIDSFNVINKRISTQMVVNYLDITGFSRLAANNPALIATDGLHPSGLEYKVWVEGLVPIIKEAVK